MKDELGQEIARLTWAGKHEEAIALARPRFDHDSTTYLMEWAVTLYSARKAVDVVEDMRAVIPLEIAIVAQRARENDADALDVISTHLVWWYDCTSESVALIAARETCELGLEVTEGAPFGTHTRALIALTYASIGGGTVWLREAERYAEAISDPNQRARVYRKLAYLYARRLRPFKAYRFLRIARLVQGIAPDVAEKNKVLGRF